MPVAGSTTGTGAPTGAPVTGAAAVVTLKVVVAVVADTPPKVSLAVMALPTLELPSAPLAALRVSSLATMADVPTVTVIVAGLQLAGNIPFSHRS